MAGRAGEVSRSEESQSAAEVTRASGDPCAIPKSLRAFVPVDTHILRLPAAGHEVDAAIAVEIGLTKRFQRSRRLCGERRLSLLWNEKEDFVMSETPRTWKYLERRPGSSYQQLCIKGKRIWAWTLYCEFMSEKEARTAQTARGGLRCASGSGSGSDCVLPERSSRTPRGSS